VVFMVLCVLGLCAWLKTWRAAQAAAAAQPSAPAPGAGAAAVQP
jgi:hypothetical protein